MGHDLSRRTFLKGGLFASVALAAGAGLTEPFVYGGIDRKRYIIETNGCGVAFLDYDLPRAQPYGPGWKERRSSFRTWLPTSPFNVLQVLPEHRKRTYVARFVARTRRNGWLIQRADVPLDPMYNWLLEEISKTHTPVATRADAHWRLTWFKLKDKLAEGQGPAPLAGARATDGALRR